MCHFRYAAEVAVALSVCTLQPNVVPVKSGSEMLMCHHCVCE